MAQTKFNCPNPSCKRLIPINSEYCPYCSTKIKSKPVVKNVQEQSNNDNNKPNFTQQKYEEIPIDIENEQPPVQKEPQKPASSSTTNTTTHSQAMIAEELEEREKIPWDDTKKEEDPDISKMYLDGKYNPNYNGYYDDIQPKIRDEIDSLAQGKEKTIIKIIFGIIAIAAIIVYLVLTI